MGIFFDMDQMIGKDFEAGLVNLKTLAERLERSTLAPTIKAERTQQACSWSTARGATAERRHILAGGPSTLERV